MKKSIFCWLIILLFSNLGNAQIYDSYPKNEVDYRGGNIQLFKDLHEIFQKHHLMPCDDKNELVEVKYIVYPDATIKFYRTAGEQQDDSRNQCTQKLIKESFPYLDGWKPAEINGAKVAAMSAVYIYPDDLFDNYRPGYDIDDYAVVASFEGGINVFRQRFLKNFYMPPQTRVDTYGSIMIEFMVDENGQIQDLKLEKSTGDRAFDNMVLGAVRKVKGKWIPATIRGIPIEGKLKFPVRLTSGRP